MSSFYNNDEEPEETLSTCDEFLLYQMFQSIPAPVNKWNTIQKETVRVYHPGIAPSNIIPEECLYCKIRNNKQAAPNINDTANALLVIAKKNIQISNKERRNRSNAPHAGSKNKCLPMEGLMVVDIGCLCRITSDRLNYIYNKEASPNSNTLKLTLDIIDHVVKREIYIPDEIGTFVTEKQFVYSNDVHDVTDTIRCANYRRCSVYLEVNAKNNPGNQFLNSVIFNTDISNCTIFKHCPLAFTNAYVNNYFPIISDPFIFDCLYHKYGEAALEYINIFQRDLCFKCTMESMCNCIISSFTDSCHDPLIEELLETLVAIYKPINNKLIQLNVKLIPCYSMALPIAPMAKINMLENKLGNAPKIVKDVVIINYDKSFKESVEYEKDNNNEYYVKRAFKYIQL